MKRKYWVLILTIVLIASGLLIKEQLNHENEADNDQNNNLPSRESRIPNEAVKVTPQTDAAPPQSLSPEYSDPVPVPGKVNTAGAEDSAFILPDGNILYFFFVPDVRLPVEQQVLDTTVGIYVSKIENNSWTEPERIVLQDPGKLAMDGAEFVQGDLMYFCSVREGYTGIHWFKAEFKDGKWQNWQNADQELKMEEYEVGELHVSSDGNELYFHSARSGGEGGLDIWVSEKVNGNWSEPVNVAAVNTERDEGWPALSPDGNELWFSRDYGVWRSQKVNGEWQTPEEMFFPLAGEPSIDSAGNVYFTHHFFKNDTMVEADIYVAFRKPIEKIEPLDSPELPSRGFYKGFLPIPAEGQSFDEAFLEATQSVEFIPVWGRPTPFYELPEELNGSWGKTFVGNLIRGNGMFPLIHFSFIGPNLTLAAPPGMYNATLSDPAWRQAYIKSVVDTLRVSKPLYLSLGNEVNRWYEKYGADEDSPNGFQHFVSLYEEIYDVVKEISPETKVFCVFAREIVAEYREADLKVLSMFDPDKMDILVFTSYPFAVEGINSPADIPDGYYKKAFDYISNKSFGFSELAWPSMEAFGGEQGQVDFIMNVTGRLTKDQNIDLHLLGWAWLHDIDEHDYTGLKKKDGTEKLAYEVWKNI
jgi:hypothetical protein